MTETHTIVNVDFYQYYVYGVGGDFDESSVDMANDGILAPGASGIRVCSGAHMGQAELTVRVTDTSISLPSEDTEAVASACNLDLPSGTLVINSFGGPIVFEHVFGRPLTCGFLVEVHDRDLAHAHRYQPDPAPLERHLVTISSHSFPDGRWGSTRLDNVGKSLETFTDHVARASGPS